MVGCFTTLLLFLVDVFGCWDNLAATLVSAFNDGLSTLDSFFTLTTVADLLLWFLFSLPLLLLSLVSLVFLLSLLLSVVGCFMFLANLSGTGAGMNFSSGLLDFFPAFDGTSFSPPCCWVGVCLPETLVGSGTFFAVEDLAGVCTGTLALSAETAALLLDFALVFEAASSAAATSEDSLLPFFFLLFLSEDEVLSFLVDSSAF